MNAFIVLVLLSAFYASAETAFFTLHRSQVLSMQKQGKRNANLIKRLKSDPQRLLITILIGNDVVNIFAASLATLVSIRIFGSLGVGIATGITTVIVLIFGDIIPKSYAQKHSKVMAQQFALPVFISVILFWPISSVLIAIDNFFDPTKSVQKITEDEIQALSRAAAQMGSIHELENTFIENIFSLHDTPIGKLMAPKKSFIFLNADKTVEQIQTAVGKSIYSRSLVYQGEQSNIIGFVHANQILDALYNNKRDMLMKKLARPIKHVSAEEKMEHVLTQMIADRESIYLVHRKGNKRDVIGIVTLKDILEKLVRAPNKT